MFKTPPRKFGYKYYEIELLTSDGYSDIYSVQKLDSGIFALKLFKKGFSEEKFAKQIKIYSLLSQERSPFFLKYISNSKDELIVREKYIVLEFVEKGELKNYILSGKFFPEKLAKIAVYKIIGGISEMHRMGIVHKKISIEKIFLDKFYNFKIGDFGCAEFVGEDQKHLFKEDILDAGIVIIQLLTGKLELKIIKDKIKTAIKKGNLKSFWRLIENQGGFDFSPELKNLLSLMFAGQITDIRKLLNHDWFDKIHSICPDEFRLHEQFMRNELKKYEGDENGESQA